MNCSQGWLGGWVLPQEKSYFALKLPHGWWVFGVDLALVGDIDICQLRCVDKWTRMSSTYYLRVDSGWLREEV